MKGAATHRAGVAAEGCALDTYLRAGLTLVAERWRGIAGEIDLILRDGPLLVFVEVKKSGSFARAMERMTPRKVERILATAEEYLGRAALPQCTEMRFDVALVEGSGRVQVIENALGP